MRTRQPFPYNVEVSSKHGAPMGRRNIPGDDAFAGLLHVRKVPFYDGDYDGGGAYWGARSGGWALFCAFNAERSIVVYFDAKGPADAVAMMRDRYASATFKG